MYYAYIHIPCFAGEIRNTKVTLSPLGPNTTKYATLLRPSLLPQEHG
jgi:hypothetical protein